MVLYYGKKQIMIVDYGLHCRLWNYRNANLVFGTKNTERVKILNTGGLVVK